MTEKRTRPPFILMIIADSQGCGWHRGMIPLGSLVESGVADGRIDQGLWPDNVLQAAAPDVIVLQRQVEDGALDTIERWKKLLPNTLFIYELDDYLGEIPPASFHAGFMPPNIADKVSRGVQLCDRTTTTTEPMAQWLMSLGAKDVRIVPNALPVKKLFEREPRQTGKLRVGFAGGMSHSGDLKLIEPAMEAIGDEVEWVFFGTRPDGAKGVKIEFHEGQSPQTYLDGIAKLDVDVFLAPLEDNMFNRCKSNLRLVEAGAVGACVIAQDMPTYHVNDPPVFLHANTPDEWTAAIRHFVRAPIAVRRRNADALRAWVGRHYILERVLKTRMDAWLPDGEKWRPQNNTSRRQSQFVVSTQEERESLIERLPFLRRAAFNGRGLEQACEEAIAKGADLLWLRPATNIGENSWNSLISTLHQSAEVASAVPVASDGMNAFPKVDEWMPMSAANVASMEAILSKRMHRRRLSITAPFGPCVLLSATALGMLGAPDVAGCGSEEQAILEWGLRAAMREWKHMQAADAFASSLAPPPQVTPEQNLRLQARGTATRLQQPPEAFTSGEREAVELELLGANWGGPRPGSLGFGTDYESWKALTEAKQWVADVPSQLLPANPMPVVSIVQFGSAPKPFGWLVHIDDSVELDVGALDAFMSEIWKAVGTDVQVVYFDHESKFIDDKVSPEFKPDFDLELFLAQDYVTPICAVRANVPFADRAALFAHVLDIALKDGRKAFAHIARCVGSMRVQVRPEEMALDALQRQIAIQDRLGDGAVVTAHRRIPGCLSIVRNWRIAEKPLLVTKLGSHISETAPLVSIVIPTLGSGRLIQPCVNTIRQHTDYPNYEIIVVQNGERQDPELGEAVNDPRVKVVHWTGPFNWSAINNWAIRFHCKGDYICTVNDDVCVGTKPWLDNMMGHAVLPDVGAVGARLLHPAGFIQHVGVIAHKGVAGHMHKGMPNGQLGHLGRAVLTHEAIAVTGACMLFKRSDFDAVGGFDEEMPRNYNDTDFCIRLHTLGRRNVVEMTAELLHPEGASRGDVMSPDSLKLLAQENRIFAQKHPGPDPYWNPALSLGLVHGGVLIQGLNAEVLGWDDFRATERQERVLTINDLPGAKGVALDLIKAGSIPMAADLSGFRLKMTGPIPRNTPPWDVRDPARIKEGLKLLGVTRIVLRSLVGAEGAAPPVEALRCLIELGVVVNVDPIEDWMVRPVTGDGYEDQRRAFGSIDVNSWKAAYRQLESSDPLVQFSALSLQGFDQTAAAEAGEAAE